MKTTLRMLVVEDDRYFLQHVVEILKPFGLVETAIDAPSAQRKLQTETYDLLLTDLHLPEGPQGLELLGMLKPGTLRIMLTSSEDEALIAEAYRRGAQHVLSKKRVREHLPTYLKSLLSVRDLATLQSLFENRFPTRDPLLMEEITRLMVTPWGERGLLITGPTGTGKTMLGKILAEHLLGPDAPFIHLNCSELPDNLLESELFGHEKGAFTGADQKREGKLKLASGGVLFLDEVATMSPSMQQKLLKAIEEKTFFPIGARAPERSSFILMTATCEDLEGKIRQGLFREDLYFRLSALKLRIPALKDRRFDIERLVRFFLQQSPRKFIITSEAMLLLQQQEWQGNVRQLRQVVLSLADTGAGLVDESIVARQLGNEASREQTPTGLINDEIRDYVHQYGLKGYFQIVEKAMAEESLRRNCGKITLCMKELQISSSTFYRIMQEHRLS